MEADDGSIVEFSTIKGQWSLTDSPTVTVHLKVAFHDEAADNRSRTALQATAIVDNVFGECVAYTGSVIGDKAADQSLHSGVRRDDDESAAVRIWLRDARAALVDSGDEPTTEYEYHLRREDGDDDRLLTLAWKVKLRPFGLATLGTVQMTEVTPRVTAAVSLTCTSFVTPLIRMLSAERKHQKLYNLSAKAHERSQSEDNRRLLDELRSMVDSRQLDDQRLMARFVEVLNEKKRRIADLQQELAELKLGRDVLQPVVITAERENVKNPRRRGRGNCRDRPGSIKKIRQSTTREEDIKKWDSSPEAMSEDENTALQLVSDSNWCPELEEMNRLNRVNISGNVVDPEETSISNSIPVSPILPVSTTDVPIDPRYFADTQVDSPDSSPTWLQQPLTVSQSPRLQPSINQHGEHQLLKKKSVLDDLWSGIL